MGKTEEESKCLQNPWMLGVSKVGRNQKWHHSPTFSRPQSGEGSKWSHNHCCEGRNQNAYITPTFFLAVSEVRTNQLGSIFEGPEHGEE